MRIIIIGTEPLEFESEDSGQALIGDQEGNMLVDGQAVSDEVENGLFVRLQSWCGDKKHDLARSLEGKRVRVIIETLDDP